MSHSLRHTPIFGMTMAESEKQDKRLANRRHRRGENQRLHARPEYFRPFSLRAYSNVWSFDKDGKHFWQAAQAKDLRK